MYVMTIQQENYPSLKVLIFHNVWKNPLNDSGAIPSFEDGCLWALLGLSL